MEECNLAVMEAMATGRHAVVLLTCISILLPDCLGDGVPVRIEIVLYTVMVLIKYHQIIRPGARRGTKGSTWQTGAREGIRERRRGGGCGN